MVFSANVTVRIEDLPRKLPDDPGAFEDYIYTVGEAFMQYFHVTRRPGWPSGPGDPAHPYSTGASREGMGFDVVGTQYIEMVSDVDRDYPRIVEARHRYLRNLWSEKKDAVELGALEVVFGKAFARQQSNVGRSTVSRGGTTVRTSRPKSGGSKPAKTKKVASTSKKKKAGWDETKVNVKGQLIHARTGYFLSKDKEKREAQIEKYKKKGSQPRDAKGRFTSAASGGSSKVSRTQQTPKKGATNTLRKEIEDLPKKFK